MGLQRQQRTSESEDLKGQLLQWSADKREAERRAAEEEERQAEFRQAASMREDNTMLTVTSIVTIVLGVTALVCGIITGDKYGTALWIGLVAMIINSFIVGGQVEFSRDRSGFFHESILLKVGGIISVIVLVIILLGKGKALIILSVITIISELIVYCVAKSNIDKLNAFIGNEKIDYED